jgi:hypothetical protein
MILKQPTQEPEEWAGRTELSSGTDFDPATLVRRPNSDLMSRSRTAR